LRLGDALGLCDRDATWRLGDVDSRVGSQNGVDSKR